MKEYESDGVLSNYCTQTFTILDKWLNEVGSKKGEDALQEVKSSIANNIQANIAYYEELAKEAEKSGSTELAAKNRLLAKLYRGLLQ